MNTNKKIQIFNPRDWESYLLASGANTMSFTMPTHQLFHINRIEDYLHLVNFSVQDYLVPTKLTFYSIHFMTKGECTRTKGLTSYRYGKNTFFFLPAYEITIYEGGQPEIEGFYIHFSIDLLTLDYRLKDLLQDFPFLNFNCYPLITIDDSTKEDILPLLTRLEKEYKCGVSSPDIFRSYLIALFCELKQHLPPPQQVASNAASILAEQYKNALARHFPHKQKVADYAEILCVTPNHLNKCVHQALNKSASDLLQEMLLLEAKVLLKQTNLTVSEIAYKLGRDEVANFNRLFKSKTGMTPKEYRLL